MNESVNHNKPILGAFQGMIPLSFTFFASSARSRTCAVRQVALPPILVNRWSTPKTRRILATKPLGLSSSNKLRETYFNSPEFMADSG